MTRDTPLMLEKGRSYSYVTAPSNPNKSNVPTIQDASLETNKHRGAMGMCENIAGLQLELSL